MAGRFLQSVLVCAVIIGAAHGIAIKKGSAYSDVTVAISQDVPEDHALLDSIKDQFTRASRVLYAATGGWAYFKEVVIAVPSQWAKSPQFSTVYKDPYPLAEFRIDVPNGAYGNLPYTLQPGSCGEPGDYVHLTPEFVKDKNGAILEAYGPTDRLIIHEWAHVRYGIFDEYGIPGDKKFPLFYFDDGFMRTSVCSEDVKGYIESDSGSVCAVFNDRAARDCVFIPDMNDDKTRASLMSLPYMPSVDRFCTNSSVDGTLSHNWRAPTKQNLLCHRRSSWEVISGHPDFSFQPNSNDDFIAPIFKIQRVEKLPPRFVFVLDVSGSMTGHPLVLMKQSTNWFVRDLVKDDSFVSVVVFNSGATVIQSMVKVNSPVRSTISAKLQSMQAGGGTHIGAGIERGILDLKASGQPTEDALIILISDGETNPPVSQQVFALIQSSKVKVWTIAFGKQAPAVMEQLAVASGGKGILIQNIQGGSTADLDQFFVGATTTQGDVNVQMIQLLNKEFILRDAVTKTTVPLDAELGSNTVFTLVGQIAQVDFDLASPTGKLFVASDSTFSRDAGRIQYKLPTADSGMWTLTIRKKAGGDATVDLSVVSEPRNAGEHPIKVTAKINAAMIQYPKPLVVIARVTKGADVVIRAQVKGEIVNDIGREVEIDLKDDGAGADVVADDGTYSGYFTQYQVGAKRYTVVASVVNRGQAFIKKTTASFAPTIARRKPRVTPKDPPSQSFKLDKFQKLDHDPDAGIPIGDPAADFDRTTNGGSFILENFNKDTRDMIKPSPVNDLSVVGTGEAKDRQKYVILEWTAPGDDMDSGTPVVLELRVSLNGDRFVRDFPSGHILDTTHVLNGSLTPQAGGSKQRITVYLPKELLADAAAKKSLDVYLSVKATDKAGNVGDLGNIVAAHFGYEIPICLTRSGMFPKARVCTQFYHCSNGQPYLKNCPGGLHFSSESQRCEWPCSAKCDSRLKCAPQS